MTPHKSAFEFKINVSFVDGYFLAHKGGRIHQTRHWSLHLSLSAYVCYINM